MTDILLVDDNSLNLALVARWLEIMGCNTSRAHTGEDGFELAINEIPSLILLDIHLPDMDGYEVLAALKKHPDTSEIPVIAVTGLTSESDRLKALDAGFDDYMPKPINFTALITKINTMGVKLSYIPPKKKKNIDIRRHMGH